MLTHVILADMVKVRGQVSELALCLIDDEPRIQVAARLELAQPLTCASLCPSPA